jgi:transposase
MGEPCSETEIDRLREENAHHLKTIEALNRRVESLQQQLDWFTRQLFGQKSEKLHLLPSHQQPSLFDGLLPEPEPLELPEKTIPEHTRRSKSRAHSVTDTGLRFDDSVPVQDIEITPPELKGPDADDYQIIRYDETHRLAQRPGSYVILRERRPVLKHQPTQVVSSTPAPERVIEGSIADVSFLAGLLIDKFTDHLPLYRQHQRLQRAGIRLARGTLVYLVQQTLRLLRPIADAQLQHALLSHVLTMDETPGRAGRKAPGKMNQGYFWPLYGDQDEVCFLFRPNRSGAFLSDLLKDFHGVLLTDGYTAYQKLVASRPDLIEAQCWSHTRRYFERALDADAEAAQQALAIIAEIYRVEQAIREQELQGEAKKQFRQTHSAPWVATFWSWCEQQANRTDLHPSHPLSKALGYALPRRKALEVFLEDPEVPPDTNHIERTLRVIPMGKKNWLFCWSEAGAEDVAVAQSLLATCRLHDINPYNYLVDVLQRISHHPQSRILELTPRLWKQKFADNPLRSMVDLSAS